MSHAKLCSIRAEASLYSLLRGESVPIGEASFIIAPRAGRSKNFRGISGRGSERIPAPLQPPGSRWKSARSIHQSRPDRCDGYASTQQLFVVARFPLALVQLLQSFSVLSVLDYGDRSRHTHVDCLSQPSGSSEARFIRCAGYIALLVKITWR